MRAAAVLILSLSVSLPAATAGAQRVVKFDRPAYRLHSIGQRLSMRVLDSVSGRPVPTASMAFRVADPAIASVNPRGEVVSRKDGLTKVWAIAGRDSASAYVMVEQRAARFAFSPNAIRFDALSARLPIKVQVSDSVGVPIAGNASAISSCRSLNEDVVTLTNTGEAIAIANGATWIRCTDRGFADSVRVEVRQRAARAQVIGTKNLNKVVGDTFSVRLRAIDRQSKEIADARATWVSLDTRVVTVDPTTGRALAKGQGGTRIIAQFGDVADTANVSVSIPAGGGLLQAPAVVVDTTPKAAALKPTVQVVSLSMVEGESKVLNYSVKDTNAVPINDAKVTIRSSDTATVMPIDSGRVLGKKQGMAYVTVRFGTIIDSAMVNVRAIGDTTGAGAAAAAARDSTPFVIPEFKTDSLQKLYKASRDSAMVAIKSSAQFAPSSGRIFTGGIFAGLAAHSSYQVTNAADTTVDPLIEDRSGVIFGGRGSLKPFGWLSLSGDFRRGSLTPAGTIGEPMTITEASGELLLYFLPGVGLGGGYAIRGERTALAFQTWKVPRGILTAKMNFVGDAVSTTTTFLVQPAAQFSGTLPAQQPGIGLAGEAGLEVHRGKFDAAFLYYVEKFSFPEITGSSRTDQYSSLRARIGFKIGR